MKKPDKRETLNLFFSAFLIIAFIVCAHFFSQFADTLSYPFNNLVCILLYIVFGLLLFYATRVGDGKAVKRFSPVTLIIMVVPTLYIFIASIADFMPLHDIIAAKNDGISIITVLAGIAMGYGIPYSFFSGFELQPEDADAAEEPEVLEGGIEADLLESEQSEEEAAQTEDSAEPEAVLTEEDPARESDAQKQTEE